MAKYTLTIETNDPVELADITAAIAEEQGAVDELPPTAAAHRNMEQARQQVAAAEVAEAPKPRRGRPAKATEPASDAARTEETAVPAEETPSASSPSTTASPSEPAKTAEGDVTAQDCKLALNGAMDRDVPPNRIQAAMLEKFGAGSIMKIEPARYGELKVFLEGLQK